MIWKNLSKKAANCTSAVCDLILYYAFISWHRQEVLRPPAPLLSFVRSSVILIIKYPPYNVFNNSSTFSLGARPSENAVALPVAVPNLSALR